MNILYQDNRVVVCVKPVGVVSTDEAGGVPSLVREALGDSKVCVRTVHRLDQVVGGVMVLARSRRAAQLLSEQVSDHKRFQKQYLAVVHGTFEPSKGQFCDLLWRDTAERRTLVVDKLGKGVQEAVLDYEVLSVVDGLSLVRVTLHTGRTHQIRCQLSAHGCPIVGDKKYGAPVQGCTEGIALWSYRLGFEHPQSGERLCFVAEPPEVYPWTRFDTGEEESR